MSDWGEVWELPEYPQLPKLFTNAKTAKKRKHKEFIVTDELLDNPVKLPKRFSGSKDNKSGNKHQTSTDALNTQQQAGASAPAISQLQQTVKARQEAAAPVGDDCTVQTGHNNTKKKKKKQKQSSHGSDTAPQTGRKDGKYSKQQQEGHGSEDAAHATDNNKSKKKRKQATAVIVAAEPVTATQPDLDGPAKKTKKSKNKFKQQEFLEHQQQLQQQLQEVHDQQKLKVKAAQQQKQQEKLDSQQQQQAMQMEQQSELPGHRTPLASSKKAKKVPASAAKTPSRTPVAKADAVQQASRADGPATNSQHATPLAAAGSLAVASTKNTPATASLKSPARIAAATAPGGAATTPAAARNKQTSAQAGIKSHAADGGVTPKTPRSTQHDAVVAVAAATATTQKSPAANLKSPAAAAVGAAAQKTPKSAGSSGGGGSKLLQQFKERLQGSKFRQLNEALYTQPGEESYKLLQEQPDLFEQYHEGFQQQVKSWPTQPLDAAIAWLGRKPDSMVVADFGCGDARLAATVRQKVHSLDLVANAPGVMACNMAHTPLDNSSCDAAVFSLALMGVDYGEFLVEAARVLKLGGWLWIAEVRSRFVGSSGSDDFRPFLAALEKLGFKLVKQDAKNKMFVVFVLKKQQQVAVDKAVAIKWPSLKACVYKKR